MYMLELDYDHPSLNDRVCMGKQTDLCYFLNRFEPQIK